MVGSSHHNFISSSYAQVYLDESSLMKLQKSSEGKRVIVDYIPWLPSLKVEKFTNSFLRNCQEISLTDADQHTNLDPYTLLITLAPLSSTDILDLQNLFQNFPSSIQLQLDDASRLSVSDQETHISLTVDSCTRESGITKVVTILTSLPYTLWVERRQEFHTHNRWARGLCQSGTDTSLPMYGVNITGRGYIIGVSDTGIDMTHCHFYDPDNSPPYNTVNRNHRKVIYYNKYVDGSDDSEGHGTHVSSTTSGQSYIDYGDFRSFLPPSLFL
jgi:subtilisin family serine protease